VTAARSLVGVVVLGAAALGLWSTDGRGVVLSVPDDYPSVAAALEAAPAGAAIVVQEGNYRESVTILRPITLQGQAGAQLHGESGRPVITVEETADVRIRGLRISGGETGVLVLDSVRISIEENEIVGNELRGIRALGSSVLIRSNLVADTWSPYGIGIHVANAITRPPSVVEGNTVEENGAGGIVVNLAEISIRDNTVRRNGYGGIAVNEMSVGSVVGNRVEGNVGTGILVMDMSTATLRDNEVLGTVPGPLGRVDQIRLEFHAVAELVGNVIHVDGSCGVSVSSGSLVTGTDNRWEGIPARCMGLPAGFLTGG
jgi:parallel beta-helix repeat protein